MNSFLYSLCVLIGVAAYAAITHLVFRPKSFTDEVNNSFSSLSMSIVAYTVSCLFLMSPSNRSDLSSYLHWNQFLLLVVNTVALIFVINFTRKWNNNVLVPLMVTNLILSVVTFSLPGGYKYVDLHYLSIPMNYLDATALVAPTDAGLWFFLANINFVFSYLYMAYLMWRKSRKDDDYIAKNLSFVFCVMTLVMLNTAIGQYSVRGPFQVLPFALMFMLLAISSIITRGNRKTVWKQAHYDQLTRIPNRKHIYDTLTKTLIAKTPGKDSSKLLALLFIDLDHFKEVNDSLGHNAGDSLLVESAKRMKSCVRSTDLVGRLGGDEFVVVLNSTTQAATSNVAENLLAVLSSPFLLEGEAINISASIGITLHPTDAVDVVTLFKNADQAMYASKKNGRNKYQYYTPSLREESDKRARIISNLHKAVNEDQFVLHYQPIVDLKSGKVTKAEALIRWDHPTYGLVPPQDFISIAEETGIILSVGDWAFQEACEQCAIWRKVVPDFSISVNVSVVQIRSSDCHGSLSHYLKKSVLPGSAIIVEITEGTLLDNTEVIKDKLEAFRSDGIEIALDDFGTGYSSLSYLKKFQIDQIKIDQSFVTHLSENTTSAVMCEAIVAMAHKMGLKVIAEGIETKFQAKALRDMGCDYGQGFYFSQPLDNMSFSLKDIDIQELLPEESPLR